MAIKYTHGMTVQIEGANTLKLGRVVVPDYISTPPDWPYIFVSPDEDIYRTLILSPQDVTPTYETETQLIKNYTANQFASYIEEFGTDTSGLDWIQDMCDEACDPSNKNAGVRRRMIMASVVHSDW